MVDNSQVDYGAKFQKVKVEDVSHPNEKGRKRKRVCRGFELGFLGLCYLGGLNGV